jgi:RNA polymerase sigma factor (sigma-70 family)
MPGPRPRPPFALPLRQAAPPVGPACSPCVPPAQPARGDDASTDACVSGSAALRRLSIGERASLTPSTDFDRAYARFLPPIRAKCRRLLGRSHAADDVAQEAFFRLWKSGAVDADPRAVMAWLYRTATRLAIDVLRDRRRSDVGDAPEGTLPCAIDLRAYVEARETIASLAESVPEDELAAAVLCRVDGLPQPEAAVVLGVSERTVRRMLDRFDDRTRPFRRELSS